MSINHNRIKVADLEINEPNKILTTNTDGELEFSDINNIKTASYNALDYSIAGKTLDARQGKILKDLIDNINALLASDNSNLNTVQELVDAIETVQTSLNTLLVNDLTTGGTTKALTAEMGKSLKTQVDTLTTVVSGKQNTLTFSTDLEIDKASTTKVTAIKTLYDWAVAKFVQITNIKTVNGIGLIGTGNITTPDMDTATAQTVSGVKTFLAGKFGLRNTANTFTSFFSSAVTTSRTWIWPDKDGTVAMTSDIVAQLNGKVNYLVKFSTTTTGTISRLFDNGTFFGIDNVKIPLKDITLGYQSDRVIGIEQSDNSTVGRSLSIEAGRTINFSDSVAYTALNQVVRNYTGVFSSSYSANIYTTVTYGDIYKQTAGVGNFVALGQTVRQWSGICEAPNGDVYACVGGGMSNNNTTGDIYKQTGGVGNFVALGQSSRSWAGMCAAPNGDIYAAVGGGFAAGVTGDIYKQTGGVGNFVALGQISRSWQGMCAASNGDIYATVRNGDIYKQTGGVGDFVALGQVSRLWSGITKLINGDLIAVTGFGGNTGYIYKQTGGIGSFVAIGEPSRSYNGVGTNNGIDVYAITYGGDIYKQNNQDLGVADLNGGTLKLKSGTGKGTGQSRVQIITGNKLVSGTDMQVETVRAEFDEAGNYKRIGTPVYADNTAALSGGLTAGMEYRTSAGVKMEVY